jgi:hypothetical protein
MTPLDVDSGALLMALMAGGADKGVCHDDTAREARTRKMSLPRYVRARISLADILGRETLLLSFARSTFLDPLPPPPFSIIRHLLVTS